MSVALRFNSAVFQYACKRSIQPCLITQVNHSSNGPKMAVSDDKSMILCWHPERKFPYEFTKPVPRTEKELVEGDPHLKAQYYEEDKKKYSPDGPTRAQLMKMFYTTRHTFDRKSARQHYRRIPKERDSI